MITESARPVEKVSDENRIDRIRNLRNELIRDFQEEQNLRVYFKEHYKSKLNPIRIEFIKKELQDLLISHVDLVHYASLLIEMKHNGTASITGKNEDLFYAELEVIFRKYVH